MIVNIIDKRKNKYRWKDVNAVIEDAWHDNTCEDSDQEIRDDQHSISYEERIGISLKEAISWAQEAKANVTLYIYSRGDGIE